MNWEVVRRLWPCALYADGRKTCRWCRLLTHVRVQGTSRTLCGHACTPMEDWFFNPDAHPEDVGADVRCAPCFERRATSTTHARVTSR